MGMTVFILFTLAVLIGAALLAHHMGVEYGYEHGYNDARHDILCRECRMSEGYGMITSTDNNNERNQR